MPNDSIAEEVYKPFRFGAHCEVLYRRKAIEVAMSERIFAKVDIRSWKDADWHESPSNSTILAGEEVEVKYFDERSLTVVTKDGRWAVCHRPSPYPMFDYRNYFTTPENLEVREE